MEYRTHAPGGGERRGRGVARTAAAISARPQQTPDLRSSTTAQSHCALLHSGVCTDDTSWHADEQETLSLPISSRRHRLLT